MPPKSKSFSTSRHQNKTRKCKRQQTVHLFHTIRVHRNTLCRRQIINTPPAHLQAAECHNQNSNGTFTVGRASHAKVRITQIQQPCCRRPCFLRIPCPVMPPRFLCPKSAKQHPDGHECQTHTHQFVDRLQPGRKLPHDFISRKFHHSHQSGSAQQGITEHIHNHMRSKPRRLQCRHERFVVNVGVE